MADIAEPGSHTSNIIFLNRCAGGCILTPGFNDSRSNSSSIVGQTVSVTEWNKGDEQWRDLVGCVTALFDPFDFVVTDVDPGNEPHFEAIVAGVAAEIGMNPNVGGVAPFTCGIINNAITFSFANSTYYANGIKSICETVGQEVAHGFGLEHQMLCTDPMTYLDDCGLKWFQDENATCGEYDPRSCDCGGNSQNSHAELLNHFGAGEPGPDLQFVRPVANSNVNPGFIIEVSGSDYYYGVHDLEVFIDGESIGSSSVPPFIFNAPTGASDLTEIKVRARDARGYETTRTIEVNIGESCSVGDCSSGRLCFDGFCIADSTSPGGFAATCETDSTCNSDLCAKGESGGICTEVCEPGAGQCPNGYDCVSAGAKDVCWATEEPSGCFGCNSSSPGGTIAGLFLVLLGLLYQRRRRAA